MTQHANRRSNRCYRQPRSWRWQYLSNPADLGKPADLGEPADAAHSVPSTFSDKFASRHVCPVDIRISADYASLSGRLCQQGLVRQRRDHQSLRLQLGRQDLECLSLGCRLTYHSAVNSAR